ncbi:MAG: SGNH/GDSL hydrolase family protein [Chloroflexi bacterium]|nr:SGNH/GDSL hydrolase family protein [Chloroflexota bacterium]
MKIKTISVNLLVALGSILFTIFLIEGGVRLLFGAQPAPGRFTADPQLGWIWTPNYDQIEAYKQGTTFRMQVNSQGYRDDHDYAQPKPEGTIRIIALGDSIVASPGVELAKSFPQQLERLIQAEYSNQKIEVMNAGVDDYSTEQELIWLQEQGLDYEPDLLIVHVYLNDSRSFVRPSSTQAALANFTVNHSAVYTFVRDVLFTRKAEETASKEEFRFRFKPLLQDGDWRRDPEALTKLIQAADQDWGLAWYDRELQHIENQLLEMSQITVENNIPMMLIVFPVNVQLYAETETPLDLYGPQYELSQFAAQADLPLLDLRPLFASADLVEDELFYDWVHLKPASHQLVAQAIVEKMKQADLLPK